MKTALWLIVLCQLALTVEIYETENGGLNVFFGNFGYHFEGETK